jgi:hypothetical protein
MRLKLLRLPLYRTGGMESCMSSLSVMTADPHSILRLCQVLGCNKNDGSLAVAYGGLVSVLYFEQMKLLTIL